MRIELSLNPRFLLKRKKREQSEIEKKSKTKKDTRLDKFFFSLPKANKHDHPAD